LKANSTLETTNDVRYLSIPMSKHSIPNMPKIQHENNVDSSDESLDEEMPGLIPYKTPLSPLASMMFIAPSLTSAHQLDLSNMKPGNTCHCQLNINYGVQCVHKFYADKKGTVDECPMLYDSKHKANNLIWPITAPFIKDTNPKITFVCEEEIDHTELELCD